MKAKEITVLKVEPGKIPEVCTLKNDLDSLQKAVSEGCEHQGLIEIIPLDRGVVLVCHEEGKLLGLPGNRRLSNDILVGTFYVVGDNEKGNLCSLNDKQLAFYNVMFYEPEVFTKEEVNASLCFEIHDDWEE